MPPEDLGPEWTALYLRHAVTAAFRRVRFQVSFLTHPDRDGTDTWQLDTEEGRLMLSGLGPFDAQLLGAEPASRDAWWWAWDEAGTPDAPALRAAYRLRELLGAAAEQHAGVDQNVATAVAVGVLDADAVYVASGPANESVVVLLDDPRITFARTPYEHLPAVLTHVISARAAPHRDLVAGWRAGSPVGLSFADEEDGAVVVRASGLPAAPDGTPDVAEDAVWRIDFDEQDRITGIRGTVGGG